MTTITSITEHTQTLASGHRLRYATRCADTPITVVFVHGWPDSWRSFEPVLEALPPATGAISISLRGFGGSDAPADGYTPDDFAADVSELVNHLGITSAVFVGHSMGTLVVQRLAATRPDGCRPCPDRRPPHAARRGVRRGVVCHTGPRRSDQRPVRARLPVEHPRRARPGQLLRPARRREPPGPGPSLASRLRRTPHHAPQHAGHLTHAAAVGRSGRPRAPHRARRPARNKSRRPPRRLRRRRPRPNWEQPKRVAADIEAFMGELTRGHRSA